MVDQGRKLLDEEAAEPQVIKYYSYGKRERLKLIALPLVLLVVGLPICLVGLAAYLYLLLVGGRTVAGEVAALIGGCLFLLAFPPAVVNTHTEIQVREKGMLVRVFVFRFVWKLIPWDDVVRIIKSPRPDRWWKPVWVVQVKRLTFWHRLLSASHLTGWQPGIVLTSDLQNREELLKVIRERCAR